MVTEERPEDQIEEGIALNPTGTQELAPVEIKEPLAPQGLTDVEKKGLQNTGHRPGQGAG